MNKLLQDFLNEEMNEHVKCLLLSRITECRNGVATGIYKYEFNRFVVTINCESNEVTIEDDLNPSSDGEGSWPLDEFHSALGQ